MTTGVRLSDCDKKRNPDEVCESTEVNKSRKQTQVPRGVTAMVKHTAAEGLEVLLKF